MSGGCENLPIMCGTRSNTVWLGSNAHVWLHSPNNEKQLRQCSQFQPYKSTARAVNWQFPSFTRSRILMFGICFISKIGTFLLELTFYAMFSSNVMMNRMVTFKNEWWLLKRRIFRKKIELKFKEKKQVLHIRRCGRHNL